MSFSLQTVFSEDTQHLYHILGKLHFCFTFSICSTKKALAICRCNTVGSPRWSTVPSHPHSTLYSSAYPLLQLRSRELELQCCRSRLEVAESDLQAAEQERESLQRKVELLEKAMESPGSRLALRRILERYTSLFGIHIWKGTP